MKTNNLFSVSPSKNSCENTIHPDVYLALNGREKLEKLIEQKILNTQNIIDLFGLKNSTAIRNRFSAVFSRLRNSKQVEKKEKYFSIIRDENACISKLLTVIFCEIANLTVYVQKIASAEALASCPSFSLRDLLSPEHINHQTLTYALLYLSFQDNLILNTNNMSLTWNAALDHTEKTKIANYIFDIITSPEGENFSALQDSSPFLIEKNRKAVDTIGEKTADDSYREDLIHDLVKFNKTDNALCDINAFYDTASFADQDNNCFILLDALCKKDIHAPGVEDRLDTLENALELEKENTDPNKRARTGSFELIDFSHDCHFFR